MSRVATHEEHHHDDRLCALPSGTIIAVDGGTAPQSADVAAAVQWLLAHPCGQDKTDWPVLIWTSPDAPDNGTAVRIGGTEFNAKADPERWQAFVTGSWLHCAAVTREEYSRALNTGFWSDGRPARKDDAGGKARRRY